MKRRIHSARQWAGWGRGLALAAALAAGLAQPAAAQLIQDSVPELRKIDIVEHLGDTIPLDLPFVNDAGDSVTLRRYFGQGRPVLLTLAYSDCPMLCSIVLNGLTNGVRDIDWHPGGEFLMLTVSIDPTETVAIAAAKKQRYLESLPKAEADGWVFLVGPESSSKALADAIGFRYYYDAERKQYAHPAGAFVIAEDGMISRYLYGIDFKPRDLSFALMEASKGKIGNTIDRIILYCFHYDPDAKGYVLFAGNLMKLGGVLTLLLLGSFLCLQWWRDWRRSRAPREASSTT
ncbi:MAG TPA: SCO family protein [bacterium]|nr:SCO family protein [bacterium]